MISFIARALLVLLLALQSAAAFSPPWGVARRSSTAPLTRTVQNKQLQHVLSVTKGDAETEVEKLMRMARELRAEAEVAEQEVHQKLLSKKAERQAETDQLMASLFNGNLLVERLREKRYSTDTLLRIIDRLYEREIAAKGFERVESSHESTNPVQFHRVNEGNNANDDTKVVVDQEELDRILTWADGLLEATAVLDDEFRHDKETKGDDHCLSYAEHEHWNPGECSLILRHKLQQLRREHDEQFQKRQQEFYDAQRRKDLPPPPNNKKAGRN